MYSIPRELINRTNVDFVMYFSIKHLQITYLNIKCEGALHCWFQFFFRFQFFSCEVHCGCEKPLIPLCGTHLFSLWTDKLLAWNVSCCICLGCSVGQLQSNTTTFYPVGHFSARSFFSVTEICTIISHHEIWAGIHLSAVPGVKWSALFDHRHMGHFCFVLFLWICMLGLFQG